MFFEKIKKKKKLKIAMLASNVTRIPPFPPEKYLPSGWSGSTELVAHSITEELVKRGHDVTLFASGNSQTSAKLISVTDRSTFEKGDLKIHREFELMLISKAYSMAKEGHFDVIHSHYDIQTAHFAPLVDTPTVSTLHCPIGFWYDKRILYHYKNTQWYVSISNDQRRELPDLNYATTVYNGVPVDDIPFSDKKENFLMIVGRLVKEKGADIAIRVALKANIPLYIFGPVDDNSEYWEKEIKLFVDNKKVVYMGMRPRKEVFQYISKAKAILMPVRWAEPFGLVVAEAMAAGTPSIVFPLGSMQELVEDGKTGYIVKNEEEMIARINDLNKINPTLCRTIAHERFSIKAMVTGYEDVYYKIISKNNKKQLRSY